MARPLSVLALLVGFGWAAAVATASKLPPLGPAGLTIYSTPDPSMAGRPVQIAGRVPGVGAGTRVTLWELASSSFRRVATAATGADGQYEFIRTPDTNRTWCVTAEDFQSRKIGQRVEAQVTLQAVPAGSAGATARFAGYVTPSHAGERIVVERFAGGRWLPFARPRLNADSAYKTVRPAALPADVRALLAGGAVNAHSSSPELTTVGATLGAAGAMPPNYFGLNWDYGGAAMFSHGLAAEYGDLASLRPGTLRWPGGTPANYYQWQSGYPTDIGERDGFKFDLQYLAAAYAATGAAPVFDLNVMTSDLPTQERMLFAAHDLGIPIKYVELGNELYFSDPTYVQQVPTATSYGHTVAEYVLALHGDFPGVLIAAAASAGSGPPRFETWNGDMLTAAQQAGGAPDAVALHVKPGWNGPIHTTQLASLFGMPYGVVGLANATMSELPYQEPAWITEYNLYPELVTNPAQHIYAHALIVAEDALLMREIPSATLTDYWTSFSNSPNAAYIPSPTGSPALTPAGLALEWIETAAGGATTSAPIEFGGPALWHGGPPAIVGFQFSGGHEVIVNLSPRTVIAPAGEAIPSGAAYEQVSDRNPIQQVVYASQLPVGKGTVAATLPLPPYSLTLVG
jgi:hypothetical protein